MLRYAFPLTFLLMGGCQFLPEISHQPTVYNPFPQLAKVAVVPFFNMTEEPTLDGEQVAGAYFTELQSVPGFEVVPVATVQAVVQRYRLQLASAEEVRKLAHILDVDAVVVGAITDYSPYYPPRLGLQVRWYTANPCLHSIPPGYGLPWGTSEEQQIPAPLVFEAEMALAKAQMATQTPQYEPEGANPLPNAIQNPPESRRQDSPAKQQSEGGLQHLAHEQVVSEADRPAGATGTAANLPPDWPDPRGFVPRTPQAERPTCQLANDEPVLQHTAVYVGNDPQVTEALASYVYFQNDRRFGGWQGYLQRSDDYIRFCCHMHIAEMLTARGGAGETRVVWRWPVNR